jgi:hypothetical protein
LEEHWNLLCLKEVDLELHEVILVEELDHGLQSSDRQDLSTELQKAHVRVHGINDEHVAKARRLSQRIMGISIVLVDLGMLPVYDIPALLESAQEVLSTADLILKHLLEVRASGVGPWD